MDKLAKLAMIGLISCTLVGCELFKKKDKEEKKAPTEETQNGKMSNGNSNQK